MSLKQRNYLFTLYELDSIPKQLPKDAKYIIYQLERCPSTGKLHYQGYIELKQPMRVNAVKQLLGSTTVHLERRQGTQLQAIDYCRKTETRVEYPVEFGTPAQQGNRTDLDHALSILQNNGKLHNVLEEAPSTFIKYHKGLQAAESLIIKQRLPTIRDVKVTVLYGPTGTGKTHRAMHSSSSVFRLPRYNKDKVWFDGYDGELVLVIDEFHGQIEFNYFKELIDKYKMQVEIKGSMKWAEWTQVIITSNKHPKEWYPDLTIQEFEQLARRIHEIEELSVPWDEVNKLTSGDEVGRSGQGNTSPVPLFNLDESDQKYIDITDIPNNQLEIIPPPEPKRPSILKKRNRK